jgi:hypothetical protein
MKITIDTKEDSHADIQKVMQILSHFTNKTPITNYSSEPQATTESSNEGFMNMFGESNTTDTSESIQTTPHEDTPPDFSNFLNLANKEEEKKDKEPRLQFF